MADIIRVVILSFVEGLTEFIPVSSTGHLIIVNELVQLKPESFANIFNIIIQLGAIMAVVVLYFQKLNPFSKDEKHKTDTINIWKKVIIGALPAAVLGLLFDDIIDAHLMNAKVVATMLFLWGLVIILIEKRNIKNENTIETMSYRTALMIGIAQCFAMVPGTSRSAATIIGAMLLGLSRVESAEFSFFLAVPTMMAVTLYSVFIKTWGEGTPNAQKGYEMILASTENIMVFIIGNIVAFIVAMIAVKTFINVLAKYGFKFWGWYRIIVGIVLLIYFYLNK